MWSGGARAVSSVQGVWGGGGGRPLLRLHRPSPPRTRPAGEGAVPLKTTAPARQSGHAPPNRTPARPLPHTNPPDRHGTRRPAPGRWPGEGGGQAPQKGHMLPLLLRPLPFLPLRPRPQRSLFHQS